MPHTGERDPALDRSDDMSLGAAILAATERVGAGEIGGTEPRQPDPLATDEEVIDPTDEVVETPAEVPTGETDEVPGDPEEVIDAEAEGDEITAETEEEVLEVEDSEDLTPRDEEGRFQERFSGVDPKKLSPELQVVYKSMQADYTRKTQEVASQRAELQSRMTDYDEFLQDMSSETGIVRLGVELARRRPETFQAMLNKVQEIQEDPRALDQWDREQELTARERALLRKEKAEQAQASQQVSTQVHQLAREAASKYGIPFASVEAYLDNAIVIHRQQNKGRVSMDDVKNILGDYVKPYAVRMAEEKKKASRQLAQKKAQAQKQQKPRLPAGADTPRGSPPERPQFKNVDEAIDDAIARAVLDT